MPMPSRARVMLVASAAVVLLGAAGILLGLRATAHITATAKRQHTEWHAELTLPDSYRIPGTTPALPWPAQGQSALEVAGVGSFGTSGTVRPAPIASVAKLMTAYLVLHDHPLGTTGEGPTLTVPAAAAAAYPGQAAAGESLVQVRAGEVLTERQALEALLLPSADNIAWLLAEWDAGGQAAFVDRMNATATQLGMSATRYTDPSGLDPATVSTAVDQLKLAGQAMRVAALAQIVSMPEATIPVAGLVRNYNTLLGRDGIVGIKTGSTLAAGGCLVFAARHTVAGRDVLILGAVLGQAGSSSTLLPQVLGASQKLVQAADRVVASYPVVRAGQPVGTARGTGGATVALTAAADVSVLGWPGLTVHTSVHVTLPATATAGATVGTVDAAGVTSDVISTGPL